MYIGIDLFHTSVRRVRVIGTYLPCHSPRSAGKKTKRGDEPSHRSQALQEEEAEQHQDHIDEVVPLNSSMEEKVMPYVMPPAHGLSSTLYLYTQTLSTWLSGRRG
jgi:hypothetical protein